MYKHTITRDNFGSYCYSNNLNLENTLMSSLGDAAKKACDENTPVMIVREDGPPLILMPYTYYEKVMQEYKEAVQESRKLLDFINSIKASGIKND